MRNIAPILFLCPSIIMSQALAPHVGPVVQNVGQNSAFVWWVTDSLEDAKFELLETEGKALVETTARQVTINGKNLFRHESRITGLEPNRKYAYQVCGPARCQDAKTFRTAPNEGAPLSFVVIGDNGSGSRDIVGSIANFLTKKEVGIASFFLHVGDLTHEAKPEEFLNFFNAYQNLLGTASFAPTLGNHDNYNAEGTNLFTGLLALPCKGVPAEDCGRYYSFDAGDAHFVALNTADQKNLAPESAMLNWLERDLAATSKKWRIVYFHHPPFVAGHHAEDPDCTEVKKNVVPILEKHQVNLVFTGHEHSYRRTHAIGGVTYITTGGGGSSLYGYGEAEFIAITRASHHYLRVVVSPDAITVQPVSLDGEVLENFVITNLLKRRKARRAFRLIVFSADYKSFFSLLETKNCTNIIKTTNTNRKNSA